MPRLHLEELDALLGSLIIGKREIQYAVVVYTTFRIKVSEITGFLVMVLGVSSLEVLLDELDKLG